MPLGAAVHQSLDDLPFAFCAMLGGLDRAPGRRVLAEVAVDAVDEGAHVAQRVVQLGRVQSPVVRIEHERVQLGMLFGNIGCRETLQERMDSLYKWFVNQ